MRIILDQKLQDAGILKLPISLEVGSTDTIVEMLSRGLHMSFLPKFAVKDALKNNLLRHINVDPLKIKVTLWIARNRSSINNPVAEAFIQLLRNQSN
jgi:DNA-binding transcriptional LysR family regulator